MVGAFFRFFDRRSAMGLQFLVQGNMVLILFQRIMIFFAESNMMHLKGAARVDIGAVFPAQASRIGMPKAGVPIQKWVSPSLAKKREGRRWFSSVWSSGWDRSGTGLAKMSSKQVSSVVNFREVGSLADSAVAELQVLAMSSKPFRKGVLFALTNSYNGDLLPHYQKRNNPRGVPAQVTWVPHLMQKQNPVFTRVTFLAQASRVHIPISCIPKLGLSDLMGSVSGEKGDLEMGPQGAVL